MKKTWCVMVATEDYLPGAYTVYSSLQKVNTIYPFILLVNEDIPYCSIIDCGFPPEVRIFYFKSLKGDNENRELYTVNKIWAYDILMYDRIGLLDADLEIVQNIDHYLDFLPGSAYPSTDFDFNKKDQWHTFVDIGNEGGLNGTALIIQPNEEDFEKLKDIQQECINDEQIWDKMFPNFCKQYWKHLPVGDWRNGDSQQRIIHYDGFPKPWMKKEGEK